VIKLLDSLALGEQREWDFGWQQLSERYLDELAEVSKQATGQKLPKSKSEQETL